MPAPKGNQYALGNSGRPKKYETPEDMQRVIDSYFEECDGRTIEVLNKQGEIEALKKPKPYTIEGLCAALDLDRATLLDYHKQESHKEFHSIVKNAKIKVLQNLVERGLEGESNSAVSIFILKNNYGFKDKTEQEVSGKDGAPLFNDKPLTKEQLDKRLKEINKEI